MGTFSIKYIDKTPFLLLTTIIEIDLFNMFGQHLRYCNNNNNNVKVLCGG